LPGILGVAAAITRPADSKRYRASRRSRSELVITHTELAAIADKYNLTNNALQAFVDGILDRMIFDGEHLTDLMEPLDLGWRERRKKELALMDDLVPLLKKRAGGRMISGLNAYE